MYELPILYKKSKHGIQQWKIVAGEDGSAAYTEVEHGKVGGKLQVSRTNILKGKNIGKKNETTPYEQAQSEALSKWKKQQDGGYVLEQDGKTDKVLPMLAHPYHEYKHQVVFPSWVQAKLDGCLSYDTLVETKEYGIKSIGWIVDNKIYCRVKSFNFDTNKIEYKDILSHFKDIPLNEDIEWYEIELETGEAIKATGNHLVWITNLQCWRRVDELDGSESLMVL